MRRLPTVPAALAAAAIVLAGCSSGATVQSASPPGPSGGQAACQTAPAPSVPPPGWAEASGTPQVVPVLIAQPGELVCGPNRVLFSFTDSTGRPLGAPDRAASLAVYDLARDPAKALVTVDGTFVWAIEGKVGVYVANVTFPEAGEYGAEFKTTDKAGQAQAIRMTFDVQPTSGVVKVGQAAPDSKTPTLADVGGDPSRLSTDASPDPALYKTSVDQALAAHQPFVLIFATPKFCTSGQCGPTLDRLKPYATKYPSVTFIHVEPYKLTYEGGSLVAVTDANGLIPTDVTTQWGLLSEPWLFVVDRTGIVRGSFELIFSDAELTAALDAVK
ncbi:MAG TPA: hypothetical protein VJ506_00885 [Candidatus Limnocylindrales bacterium]|nr:hypothetical protein [Candidatus Limnocylindrales bacterium]